MTNSLKALLERGTIHEIEPNPGYAYDNPYFKGWVRMRNVDDIGIPKSLNFTDKLLHCVRGLSESGVTGANDLFNQLEATDWDRTSYSVELQSVWTEAFGTYVAMNELGYKVQKLESRKNKRTGKVRSPHRLKKDKSCDLMCEEHTGGLLYIVIRNDNRDLIRIDKAGARGAPLSGCNALKQWLAKQVEESVEKGANLLFVRIPVWKTGKEISSRSAICFELFHDYEEREELDLPLKETPPDFFKGIWFLNRDVSVFMEIFKSSAS